MAIMFNGQGSNFHLKLNVEHVAFEHGAMITTPEGRGFTILYLDFTVYDMIFDMRYPILRQDQGDSCSHVHTFACTI